MSIMASRPALADFLLRPSVAGMRGEWILAPRQSADIPPPRRWKRWDKVAQQRLERVTSPRLPFGGIGAHCMPFLLRDLAVSLRPDDKVPVIGQDARRQDADGVAAGGLRS